jgi:signal peptidase I
VNTVATMSPAPRDRTLSAGARSVALFTTRFAVACLLGVATGLALTVMLPTLLGGQALTVMSGSMEPVIHTGDVVITQRIAPLDARVGDIVTFRSPEHNNRLLTHRVREIHARGGDVYFVTKGDAVNGVERWSVPANGRIGRTMFRVDKFGYVVHWINRPLGRMALLLAPLLLVTGYAVARIWRTPKAEPDAVPVANAVPPAAPSEAVDEIGGSDAVRDEPRVLEERVAPDEDGVDTADEVVAYEPAPAPELHQPRPPQHGRRRLAERSALALPAVVVGGYVLIRSRSARKGNDR